MLLRDHNRAANLNKWQPKPAHSQSPPQNQLVRKFQLNSHRSNHKSDLSLQETLKPKQEGAADFRTEIEKRFKNSVINSVYAFPRAKAYYSNRGEESENSFDSSLESLRHVTLYDLNTQNSKRKRHTLQGEFFPEFKLFHQRSGKRKSYSELTNTNETEKVFTFADVKASEISHRAPQVYKKLFSLLEKQSALQVTPIKSPANPYHINQLREKFNTGLTQKQTPRDSNSGTRQKKVQGSSKVTERATHPPTVHSTQSNDVNSNRQGDVHPYGIDNEYVNMLNTKSNKKEKHYLADASAILLKKSFRNVLSPHNRV